VAPDAVSSVDPDTGELYWSVDYAATSGSIIMSPIQAGDYLYVGGYSDQNLLLKLGSDAPTAEEVWRNLKKQAVSPVNVQPILDRDTVYGIDQGGEFVAFDVNTGKRLWTTSQPFGQRPVQTATAFIVRQADRYWLFTENGDLLIAKLSKEGLTVLDKSHVIEPTNVAFGRDVVWSAPAFAGRCAFIRNDKECICVELANSH
jgi:outer membrane protein assembly factor BamB